MNKDSNVRKIVLIGPESTGKTTLTKSLAAHFGTAWVAEYARHYIDALHRPYQEEDLLEIAKGQIRAEEKALENAHQWLFCDTDLQVVKVWSENSYNRCHPWILNQIETRQYDFYFLCGIDVPWEYDPQREHPYLRAHFYDVYKNELSQRQVPFMELKGNEEIRLKTAIKTINSLSFGVLV